MQIKLKGAANAEPRPTLERAANAAPRPTLSFDRDGAVPEWARFLSEDEFRAFLDAVERDLHARGLVFEDRGDVLHVALPGGGARRVGLAHLALRCGAAGREAYAAVIADHLGRALGGVADPPPVPEGFAAARGCVKVRLYNDASLAGTTAQLISARIADDLNAIVVQDLPHMIMSVAPEHLAVWGVSAAEAFQAGLDNLSKERVEREPMLLSRDAHGFGLLGDDTFGASQILHLERHLGGSPALGALVALPSRRTLLCYPIERSTVVEAIRGMIPLVDEMRRACAGDRHALSGNLYWWRGGRVTHMLAGMNLAGLPGCVFMPPQEFIDEVMAPEGYGAA